MAEIKRLTRSKRNKILAGVCGGFGEYLEVDPVLIRVIFILILIFSGFLPGILAYFLAWIIMPEK